uniref:Lipoprotein n=1 Tax=Shewanella sp. (strain MR-7) TaxID=60481 RepID=Q0HQY3_SHESR
MLNGIKYLPVLVLLLSGCSGATFRTNVGSVALNNAIAGTVDVYTMAELSRHQYVGLGEVSATYCKTDIDPTVKVNIDDLKKDLKLQVQKLGGNAIIFYECGRGVYPACEQYLECNGEGFAIEN